MGGISKSAKRLTSGDFWKKQVKHGLKGAINPLSAKDALRDAGGDIEEMMTPDNSAMEKLIAEQTAASNKPEMPMPDDEEIRRARRRAGGASRSGRASTIMSGGMGGQGLGG